MRKILVIARWEYIERVRNKTFLISLFLMPLIMISLGILPVLLAGNDTRLETRVLAVADLTGELLSRFASKLTEATRIGEGSPRCIFRPIHVSSASDEARARSEGDLLLLRGEVDAFCLLRESGDGRYAIEYRTTGFVAFPAAEDLEWALRSVVLDDLLVSLGMPSSSAGWLDSSVVVNTVVLSPAEGNVMEYQPDEFLKVFVSAYTFLIMLFFLILSSGQLLVRSVLEEKANRIVEILVSACSPTELMTGKMLGLSGLGLTQMAAWAVIAIVLSWLAPFPVTVHENVLVLLIYFVLGYLLYASIFVAVGSPVTTEQEAQHVSGYLVIILVLPLVLTVPAIQDPGASWVTVLSYIPLLTPAMMGLRITLGTVPAGEIIATVLLLLVSIVISLFIAGRIFRIAILSTGKTPTFREVVSWVRTGG